MMTFPATATLNLHHAIIAASLPSPSVGTLWLGPIPLRAYGILMVTGMIVAAWVTYVRYRAVGGEGDVVLDTTMWAIPFGIVGARIYHVITTPSGYFGSGADPWAILRIWEGGLAIYGAVAFGAVGAVIGLRRAGQRVGPFADALAPGLLFAQAIGRVGNYFNQELFGSPTALPWGLEIDEAHLPPGYEVGTLFHPTFLYEALWNITMGLLLIYIGRRFAMKSGQLMALYMIAYPLGRLWMETMRLDEARQYLGLRLNAWTSILIIVAGIIVFYICAKVGAPTEISAQERQKYIDIVARKNPKRAAELQEASDEDIEDGEAKRSAVDAEVVVDNGDNGQTPD